MGLLIKNRKKISMDFLPLAVWAVGIAAIAVYDEVNYRKQGYTNDQIKEKSKPAGHLWLLGCLVFFILGLVSK